MALHDHAIQLPGKGQKILRFPLVRLIIAIVFFVAFTGFGLALAGLVTGPAGTEGHPVWHDLAGMLSGCTFAFLGYWLYCGLVEGRPVHELNPGKLVSQTGYGLLLGFSFITLIMLVLWFTGSYRIEGFNPVSVLAPVAIMSVSSGILEEILSRGILFRIVEEVAGTWYSIALSALIFGFMHIWNPNVTVFSCLSIALTAGVILGMLYVLTRQLWIPIGMHIGWNFTLGGIYGAPVSGGESNGLLNVSFPGPDWLTGGAFGPEASLVTLIVFLLFGAFLIRKSIRNKSYITPVWRKSNAHHP